MEAKIFNQSGDEVGTIQLADYIFGIEPNVPVMHQAMVRQQANARLGTSNTLRRGEVAGSTRKLYRAMGISMHIDVRRFSDSAAVTPP